MRATERTEDRGVNQSLGLLQLECRHLKSKRLQCNAASNVVTMPGSRMGGQHPHASSFAHKLGITCGCERPLLRGVLARVCCSRQEARCFTLILQPSLGAV